MQITLTNQEARKLYALSVDIYSAPAYAKQKKQMQDAKEMAAAMLGLTPTL